MSYSYFKPIKYLVHILLLLISFNGVAQNYADKEYYLVDSLVLEDLSEGDSVLLESSLRKYHSANDDTTRIKALKGICENMMHDDWAKYQFYQYELISHAIKTNNTKALKKSLAEALNNIGFIHNSYGQLKEALSFYSRSLTIQREIANKPGIAICYSNIGVVYYRQGQIEKALKYYSKSLKIQEQLGDKDGIANTFNKLGNIYEIQGLIKESIIYYERSLKIQEQIDDKKGIATSLNNLGLLFKRQGRTKEVMSYYIRSLNIMKEIGDKDGVATAQHNIGNLYKEKGEFKQALDFFSKSLRIREEIGDKKGIAISLDNIGFIYQNTGQIEKSLASANKSLEISQEIGYPENIMSAAKLLSKIYEERGNGMESLKMYKLYVQMRDSINNEATQKAAIRQQTQYEFEKEQIRKENEVKEQARIAEEATTRRNNLQYSLIFLGILLLFGIVLSLGFIKVSPNIAEGLIFFAFLILFEFVLVFTEPYLDNYTNGEPMYNLLANSVLALIIFPLHAILEKLLKKRIVRD